MLWGVHLFIKILEEINGTTIEWFSLYVLIGNAIDFNYYSLTHPNIFLSLCQNREIIYLLIKFLKYFILENRLIRHFRYIGLCKMHQVFPILLYSFHYLYFKAFLPTKMDTMKLNILSLLDILRLKPPCLFSCMFTITI